MKQTLLTISALTNYAHHITPRLPGLSIAMIVMKSTKSSCTLKRPTGPKQAQNSHYVKKK